MDFFKIFNHDDKENINDVKGTEEKRIIEKNDFFYPQFLKNNEQIMLFCGTDTQEAYEKNLKIMPNDWRYRDKKVFYKVNKYGYRTDEWENIDWKNSIAIFGCSYTFGIGLAEDETISYYLEELTGKRVINLGVGGGSNELSLMNCTHMINNFDFPEVVVFNWTFLDRFIYLSRNGYITNVGTWFFNNEYKGSREDLNIMKNLYNNRIKNHKYVKNINYNYKLILKAMLKNKCKFVDFSFLTETANTFNCHLIEIKSLARDLRHSGHFDAIEAANYIYSKL